MQATGTRAHDGAEAANYCRLCYIRAPAGMPLCSGCAERLELELELDPARECPACGRHKELCSISPCTSEPAAESVGTRRDVVWLALKDIVPTPTAQNSRRHYEPATIRELTQFIRQHGLLQPLCVRPSGSQYVLIFGLRWYQAAIAAGLSEVPCTILPADDHQALLINLTENLQRRQLRGSERLRAIEQLGTSGLGVRELSRRTGFAPSTISRWLRVDRDPALRAAVESGALDIGQAKILVDAPKSALPALLQEAPRLTTAELGTGWR